MKLQWDDAQLIEIIDQSVFFQCACPAQVCKEILGLRQLYAYQMGCLNQTEMDHLVHERIAHDVAAMHAQMEACLEAILKMEKWDMVTLRMPDELKNIKLKSS